MAPVLKVLLGMLAAIYGRSTSPVGGAGLTSSPTSGASEYYVATTGNDTTGDGTLSRPWATVQHARDVFAGAGPVQTQDRIIHIAPGTYPQTSSIVFTPAHSGGNGHRVWYQCNAIDATTSPCKFDGGYQLNTAACTVYSGSIMRCPVPAGVAFRTIYENGKRARVARFPNYVYDPMYPAQDGPYLRTTDNVIQPTGQGQGVAHYNPSDIDLSTVGSLTGLQMVVWSGDFANWYRDTMPITAVNTTTHALTPQRLFSMEIYLGGSGSRYYLQNLLAFLDAPGEFYHDVANGYLYYYPRDGAITSQTIVIPSVQRVFSFVGNSETDRVSGITLDGLTVEFSDFVDQYTIGCGPRWHTADAGLEAPCDVAHNYNTPPNFNFYYEPVHQWQALVYMENVDNITVQNSQLVNSGTSGVFAREYAQNVVVTNNWIHRIGHTGVYFQGNYPGEGDVNRGNTISNNIIDTYGETVGNGQGIVQQTSGHNLVSHNEIFNGPRMGSFANGGSDSMTLPANGGCQTCIYVRATTFEYLKVHDTGQDSADQGLVYIFSLNSEPGTGGPWVSNTFNQISTYGGYQHPSTLTAYIYGAYTDNRTAGQVISNWEVTDMENFLATYNESGEHTLTNIGWDPTMTNGSTGQVSTSTVNPSFNQAAMDYANIGCPSSMPWYAQAKGAWDFSDSFENGTSSWSSSSGSPVTSTAQAHTGTHSILQSVAGHADYTVLPTRRRGTATIWFYDDATNTNLLALASVSQAKLSTSDWTGTWQTWNNPQGRSIGVDTGTSTTKYVYRSAGGSVATSVTRTTGWHQFQWNYTSGTGVTFSIDGTVVGTLSGVTTFDVIAFGNFFGSAGTVYWDDVAVVDQ